MTFRVDGVSRAQCREWAKKTVPAVEKVDGKMRLLTEVEWMARVESAASRRFCDARPGPLEAFATPQAMEQFVSMCGHDDVRGIRMMEMFDTGQREAVTGEPITGWRVYAPTRRAA